MHTLKIYKARFFRFFRLFLSEIRKTVLVRIRCSFRLSPLVTLRRSIGLSLVALEFSVAAAPPSRGVLSLMGRNPGDGWRSTDEKSANKQKAESILFHFRERVSEVRARNRRPPERLRARVEESQSASQTE